MWEAAQARFFQAYGRYPTQVEVADYVLEGVLDYYGQLIQYGMLDPRAAREKIDQIVAAVQRLRQLPRSIPHLRP